MLENEKSTPLDENGMQVEAATFCVDVADRDYELEESSITILPCPNCLYAQPQL